MQSSPSGSPAASTLAALRLNKRYTSRTVVHDGERWRMVQDGDEAAALSPVAGDGRVEEVRVGGAAFAALADGAARVVMCPGTLLAHVGGVAIVERGDVVLACRWLPGVGG